MAVNHKDVMYFRNELAAMQARHKGNNGTFLTEAAILLSTLKQELREHTGVQPVHEFQE
jgi:pheromone shutdown protein TraB